MLTTGDGFGEIALIQKVARQATIKAKTALRLLVLKRKILMHYFRRVQLTAKA